MHEHDEEYQKLSDQELEQIRDNLRIILESSTVIPYVTVDWHRDIAKEKHEREGTKSPLAHTCMMFETIINTLMASYGSYQSMIAVNFLSHLTVTLDQLSMLMGEVLMEENNPKLIKVLDLLKERDLLNNVNLDDIPDVFKNAFKDEENE